jgi:hypothetical protein
MPLRLEPVEPDPFIETLSRPSAVRPGVTERNERRRRVDLVRRLMHVNAGDRLPRERRS